MRIEFPLIFITIVHDTEREPDAPPECDCHQFQRPVYQPVHFDSDFNEDQATLLIYLKITYRYAQSQEIRCFVLLSSVCPVYQCVGSFIPLRQVDATSECLFSETLTPHSCQWWPGLKCIFLVSDAFIFRAQCGLTNQHISSFTQQHHILST